MTTPDVGYFTDDPNEPVLESTTEYATCATCNRTGPADPQAIEDWHNTGTLHPFRRKGSAVVLEPPKTDAKPTVAGSRFPFDPVLRQALIDKGVLTVDDLRSAEEKINAITGQFVQGVKDDGATNPVRWGRVRSDATPS